MHAAVYYRNDDVRTEEMPVPEIGPGELLVKVVASGVCGSDVVQWYRAAKAPTVLGHEIAGEIVAVGDGVAGFKAHDRVVASHHVPCETCDYCLAGDHTLCRTLRDTNFDPGGFAEFVRIPAINVTNGVLPLPDEVSFEDGTFVEPLGCVVRAHERARIRAGETVLVIGSGISGLLHVKLAVAGGASRVIATDVSDYRLQAARRFGADQVLDASVDVPGEVRGANKGRGADRVMVCTAAMPALEQALEAVEDGGTVMMFAPYEPGTTVGLDVGDLWRRQVTLMSTYAAAPRDLATAMELIRSGRVRVADMITHRLPLAQTQEAFALVEQASGSMKVIIEPH